MRQQVQGFGVQLMLAAKFLKDRFTERWQVIKTIGLFNNKAKNIIALSRILVDRYQGSVPRDREALQSLPGVGRKTANVLLNVAFGEPTIAVDTHVFRVANRTGLAPAKTAEAVEKRLLERVPARWRQHAHHWLILHGRHVCMARKPACGRCVVRDLCCYPMKTVDEPDQPDAS
jgi:endonuclease-3